MEMEEKLQLMEAKLEATISTLLKYEQRLREQKAFSDSVSRFLTEKFGFVAASQKESVKHNPNSVSDFQLELQNTLSAPCTPGKTSISRRVSVVENGVLAKPSPQTDSTSRRKSKLNPREIDTCENNESNDEPSFVLSLVGTSPNGSTYAEVQQRSSQESEDPPLSNQAGTAELNGTDIQDSTIKCEADEFFDESLFSDEESQSANFERIESSVGDNRLADQEHSESQDVSVTAMINSMGTGDSSVVTWLQANMCNLMRQALRSELPKCIREAWLESPRLSIGNTVPAVRPSKSTPTEFNTAKVPFVAVKTEDGVSHDLMLSPLQIQNLNPEKNCERSVLRKLLEYCHPIEDLIKFRVSGIPRSQAGKTGKDAMDDESRSRDNEFLLPPLTVAFANAIIEKLYVYPKYGHLKLNPDTVKLYDEKLESTCQENRRKIGKVLQGFRDQYRIAGQELPAEEKEQRKRQSVSETESSQPEKRHRNGH